MKTLLTTLILAGTAAFATAAPKAPVVEMPMADAPVLASQFNAVLHTRSGHWQVIDLSGTRLRLQAEGCSSNPLLPTGLWLLTRNAEQQPELIAPSATVLPDGHDGRIVLRPCGSPQEGRNAAGSLQVPDALIATLEQHGNAILITD